MKLPWRRPRPEPAPVAVPDLGVAVSAAPFGATVSVEGELDIATVRQLTAALAEEPVASAKTVVVDLSSVTFIDSTGLGALMNLKRDLDARNGRLLIACPEGPARLLFDVTGVAGQLELHPTLEAAEAAAG
jgi:anti-sigma B factor antagonist